MEAKRAVVEVEVARSSLALADGDTLPKVERGQGTVQSAD